jgi:hypothetical protein
MTTLQVLGSTASAHDLVLVNSPASQHDSEIDVRRAAIARTALSARAIAETILGAPTLLQAEGTFFAVAVLGDPESTSLTSSAPSPSASNGDDAASRLLACCHAGTALATALTSASLSVPSCAATAQSKPAELTVPKKTNIVHRLQ